MVSEITTVDGFDGLQTRWDELFVSVPRSVLQSFLWARTWWKHFGEGDAAKRLLILVVEENGITIGIAPLYAEVVKTAGMASFRRVVFIGRDLSDYLDILAIPGKEETVAGSVAGHLAGLMPSLDVIQLEDITDRSPMRLPLTHALRSQGFSGDPFVNELCPRTPLLESWEATLASFGINHRREINRRKRNMSKAYAVEFELVKDPATVARDMDEFIAMHQFRWNTNGQQGVFADVRNAEFHKDIAAQFLTRGWLNLSFLRLNGNRVAANYGFRFGDDVAIYLTGVGDAGDAWKLSPGRVLMGYCMEEAIASGAKVFDFMRGTEQYKYEFDGKDVPNWTILMYRSGGAAQRFKVRALTTSLQKRLRAEVFGFRAAAREHGMFSAKTAAYLGARIQSVVHDGMIKARAPEKSIARNQE